jgi:carbon storage regulator CsrA
MLVLSRLVGERIVIGLGATRVEVEVCRISREKVRLGVHAPPCVAVHRKERWEELAGAVARHGSARSGRGAQRGGEQGGAR